MFHCDYDLLVITFITHLQYSLKMYIDFYLQYSLNFKNIDTDLDIQFMFN